MSKQLTHFKVMDLCSECGSLGWRDQMYTAKLNNKKFLLCSNCAVCASVDNPYIEIENPEHLKVQEVY